MSEYTKEFIEETFKPCDDSELEELNFWKIEKTILNSHITSFHKRKRLDIIHLIVTFINFLFIPLAIYKTYIRKEFYISSIFLLTFFLNIQIALSIIKDIKNWKKTDAIHSSLKECVEERIEYYKSLYK